VIPTYYLCIDACVRAQAQQTVANTVSMLAHLSEVLYPPGEAPPAINLHQPALLSASAVASSQGTTSDSIAAAINSAMLVGAVLNQNTNSSQPIVTTTTRDPTSPALNSQQQRDMLKRITAIVSGVAYSLVSNEGSDAILCEFVRENFVEAQKLYLSK
jgi:hypothetical protein